MSGDGIAAANADEGQTPDWSSGVELAVPVLRSQTQKLAGGEISQLVQHETLAKVVSWEKDNGLIVCEDGSEIEVHRTVSGAGDPVLEGPLGARDLRKVHASNLKWARRPKPDSPQTVRRDLGDCFALVE